MSGNGSKIPTWAGGIMAAIIVALIAAGLTNYLKSRDLEEHEKLPGHP